jgi:moderate conductance mechanosensitive channel
MTTMTTTMLATAAAETFSAATLDDRWDGFWAGSIGQWILTKGVNIAAIIVFTVLATRLIRWAAQRVARRLDAGYQEGDALVRSESAKHRQAVASVISSVAMVILYVVVILEVINVFGLPVGSLVAPAAVLGAALGFGAQRVVQDLLSGFFIIIEKQYGFGDLVQLSITGSGDAMGTVEDVTLRVTKLRTGDGEVYTIPNGQIIKSLNLSKDWARAVIDIPVPTSADLSVVNDVLHEVSRTAMSKGNLGDLLLDEPSLMGVESIELDTLNLQMVARTLPGKQFEAGRQLRALVVAALRRAGVATSAGPPTMGAMTTQMPGADHRGQQPTAHGAAARN